MKILHVSNSDVFGGAARATYRLHRALLSVGIESKMLVRNKRSDDWTIFTNRSKFGRFINMIRPTLGQFFAKMQSSNNLNYHSGNFLPSFLANEINNSDADIVHLHWVAGETLSIEDISRIKKPIVWTFHDMWPFCGMEHVTDDGVNARWRVGYTKSNNRGNKFDLDMLVWKKKKKYLTFPIYIIGPSKWMGECVKESYLFKNNVVNVIPNAINTKTYCWRDKKVSRSILGLPENRIIILFGAMGGGRDANKGYDLLIGALKILSNKYQSNEILCVVFGQSEPEHSNSMPFDTKWLGHIYDDVTLSLLYSAASVMVVPSRIESFGQTASESQACGTLVAAFNATGLKDVVKHKETGYLAKPYDLDSLAAGIQWCIDNSGNSHFIDKTAERAKKLWSYDVVAEKHKGLYLQIINNSSNRSS